MSDNDDAEIYEELLTLQRLKEQMAALKAEIDDIQGWLDKRMDDQTVDVTTKDGVRYTASVVRKFTDKFKEGILREQYPDIWKAVTRQVEVLDEKLYLKAIGKGLISDEVHAEVHSTVAVKPYVYLNKVKETSSE